MAKMDDPVNVPFNLLYLLCFESELFYSLPLKSSVFFISHCLHGICITICHKFEASASKIFVQLN